MNEKIRDRIEKALMDHDLLPKFIRVEDGATDRQDESATYYTTIHLEPALDIEKVADVLHAKMPRESCRHEHDCCGGWYQGALNLAHKWERESEGSTTLLFTVNWSMNV